MKSKATLPLLLLLFITTLAAHAQTLSENTEVSFQCPMKCEGEKTYKEPGECPVCGMDLKETNHAAENKTEVKISGAMRNVMHKGELFGTINLDTISNRRHLFGLGPVEYLKGEILIVDGVSFISKVTPDGSMMVEETYHVKAPFFVYANVDQWNEISLPDSIQTIPQLETYLDQTTKNISRPFCFKLTANVKSADIHVLNLPNGTPVHSPDDAHQNQKTFEWKNERVQLTGFFSTEHQGVFTHHDTYVHIHAITDDKMKMGHLDNLNMKAGTVKLFLPLN